MAGHRTALVRVTLEDSADGEFRVWSKDLLGLVLSGSSAERARVCSMIEPSIKALLEHRGFKVKSIIALDPIDEVLARPSPRDLDVRVHGHEQPTGAGESAGGMRGQEQSYAVRVLPRAA
jgi:hypothetical protein